MALCYDACMEKNTVVKRLTETLPGRLVAIILAVVWIVSMSAVDSNAYSVWPFLIALSVVSLLFISGMLFGGKVVRIPWMGWLMLGCGGYFFVRCLFSYSMVESWLEGSLIISCGVFYVAGIYGAQTKNARFQVAVILLAVLLNLFYFLLRPGDINMLWTGRPEYGLSGYNNPPITLFVYKNFAGAFQMIGGCILLGIALWIVKSMQMRLLCLLLAGASIASSFYCSTRVVFLLAPVLVCVMWGTQLMMEMFAREKIRKLTLLGGAIIGVYIVIEIANVFLGGGLKQMSDIDTHMRADIWKPVLNIATSGPAWGWGTMASHWEIIGEFNQINTPNIAHNEYVQVWADYGIIGLVMMLSILILHVLMGLRCMSQDAVTPLRRGVTCIAMVTLGAFAIAAASDAYWHSYAVAMMCAYCCGVLVSPLPVTLSSDCKSNRRMEKVVIGVKTQGKCGRGILALLAIGIISFTCWQNRHLSDAWRKQWVFNDLFVPGVDDKAEKRLHLLEQVMDLYPDSEVADNYFKLPHYGGSRAASETVLRKALAANPRQGYTIIMLVNLLGQQARYEEAEIMMRRYYPQEGYPFCSACNWPFFYYYNLLRWSCKLMDEGKQEIGMSMAEYALNMRAMRSVLIAQSQFANQEKVIKTVAGQMTKDARAISEFLKKRLDLLRKLGEKKDDSWMQPMEPGGKKALYPQWGIRPEADARKKQK